MTPKQIIIDCGANDGTILEKLMAAWPHADQYIAIEPQYELTFTLDRLKKKYPDRNIIWIEAAAWIKETIINLYLPQKWGGHYRSGSTVVEGLSHYGQVDYEHPTTVKAIDLSELIRKGFHPDDEIIVKMDIEGAEYQVLPKLIADGTISWINLLMVEFHAPFMPDLDPKCHTDLVKQLDRATLLTQWRY